MSFSFSRCEGGNLCQQVLTTQFKPLCAAFHLPAVGISPCSTCVEYWAAESQSTWTSVAPLKTLSTSIAVWVQVLALTALQGNWVTCNTHFCLLSLRLLSFIDKLVLFCLQIHGTLVTSSDRFCWKVFFPPGMTGEKGWYPAGFP